MAYSVNDSSSSQILNVVNAVVALPTNITEVKASIGPFTLPEKIEPTQLPCFIHLVPSVSQMPTSGGITGGTNTITLSLRVILLVKERTIDTLKANMVLMLKLIGAYFHVLRDLGQDIADVALKIGANSGGPLGVVKYAEIDYVGTEITITVTIYPD